MFEQGITSSLWRLRRHSAFLVPITLIRLEGRHRHYNIIIKLCSKNYVFYMSFSAIEYFRALISFILYLVLRIQRWVNTHNYDLQNVDLE